LWFPGIMGNRADLIEEPTTTVTKTRKREKDPNKFYVYFIHRKRKDTGLCEVCYVGKGRGERLGSHNTALKKNTHYNPLLQAAYNKQDSLFTFDKIDINLTEDEAHELERLYIKQLGRRDLKTGCLFNLTDGGEGRAGFLMSESQIEQLRTRSIGRVASEYSRQRASEVHKGKTISTSQREEHSQRMTGEGNPRYGVKLSDDIKVKIGIKHKGKIASAETRVKLSKASKGRKKSLESIERTASFHRGRKRSAETCAKISANKKANHAARLALKQTQDTPSLAAE
jgi:hypothetical protein